MSILYNFERFAKVEKVLIPWTDALAAAKAGTPIAADGTIANNGSVHGLLEKDIREYWDRRMKTDGKFYATVDVIIGGYVDELEIAENGITLTDECKAALTGIVFVNGKLPTGDYLPSFDAVEDEGKILKIVNGVVAWASPEEESEANA